MPVDKLTSEQRAKQQEIRQQQIKMLRLSQINKETLDYMFVKLPHKNSWDKFYVRYQNS